MGPHTLTVLSLSLHHNPAEVSSFLKKASEEGLAVRVVENKDVPAEMRVPDVCVVQIRLAEAVM
jgi:hypothetical protein